MKPLVSVLTPTIPGREHLLAECCQSVASQTFLEHEHLLDLDHERTGCAATLNRLAIRAQGEWLFILADDDLMLPRCLELHLACAKETDAPIVYARPLVWGEDKEQFWGHPPGIPATALIRTELWRSLGGYDETLTETEDTALWQKALDRGIGFSLYGDAPTWVYRLGHGGNKSRHAGIAS